MPEINPPNFAGLLWTRRPTYHSATATEPFWSLYRMARERLFRLGIKIDKPGSTWLVIFTPRYAPPDVQQKIDAMIAEVAQLEARLAEQHIEAEIRRLEADRVRTEERAKAEEMHKQVLVERLEPAVEAARKLLAGDDRDDERQREQEAHGGEGECGAGHSVGRWRQGVQSRSLASGIEASRESSPEETSAA